MKACMWYASNVAFMATLMSYIRQFCWLLNRMVNRLTRTPSS
ncbi:hypothetical protein LINPERHAP2_LOCUS4579 [Linum perenne]